MRGTVAANGPVGYLPQDPREGDLTVTAKDRVLSARGLDHLLREMEKAQAKMSELVDGAQHGAVREYGRIEERFSALGGYAAESDAARICAQPRSAGPRAHPDDADALGGPAAPRRARPDPVRGLRRRWRGSAERDDAAARRTHEPPRRRLDHVAALVPAAHEGGLVVISHDTELLAAVVNKVWFLDATRGEVDVYNMDWRRYQEARATDEKRRRRERANAEKKASALHLQAAKMGAKATKAVAAKNMARRADELLAGLEPQRRNDKVARIRFPNPAPCGRTPLTAEGLSKAYGSLEVFTGVDLAVDKGAKVVVLGLNGAGKTTLLRLLAGTETPTRGRSSPGTGCGWATSRRSTTRSTWRRRCGRTSGTPRRTPRSSSCAPCWERSCSAGSSSSQRAGTLSGGERTRLALAGLVSSAANVLLLDEPTNNLDPASREQVLDALRHFAGAVVLVTHDPGAVEALSPDKVIVLPDGTEDHWSADYLELVQLA